MNGPATYRSLAIHACLAALTLAVFGQVIGFEFVGLDDLSYVAENPHVLGGLTSENMAWAFTTWTETHWAPLTWLSFMLDAEIGGSNPRIYHLTSLAIHIANTAILFHVLTLMTGFMWRSAVVAALFAVHPLHVESVAWITERKDVLSGLFFLLAIWAYTRYADRPAPLRYALVLLAFALGLMAKSMVVTLPVVLLVLDVWPLGRAPISARGAAADRFGWGRLILEKVPMFVLAAGVAAAALYGQASSRTLGTLAQFPPGMRAANAVVSFAFYLQKMIWPTQLAAPYPYWPETLTTLRVAAAVLIVAGITAIALMTARSRPYVAAGWFWYLITLAPVIGLVQAGAQARADRYTYLPLIGVFVLLVWAGGDLAERLSGRAMLPRGLALAGAAVVLALLAWAAHVQASYWRTSTDLFTRALAVTDRNAVAHNGIGLEFLAKGEVDRAITHFEEAIRIWPSYVEAHVNLATASLRSGRIYDAVTHYREAARLRPEDGPILAHLGAALLDQGAPEEAAERLGEAVRLAPDDPFAREQLARALAAQGRSGEAVGALREAVRLGSGDVEARVNLGIVLLREERFAEAESELREAIRIAPDHAGAHKTLGVVLARRGRIEEAAGHFAEAVRLDPADEGARKNLERARSLLTGSP